MAREFSASSRTTVLASILVLMVLSVGMRAQDVPQPPPETIAQLDAQAVKGVRMPYKAGPYSRDLPDATGNELLEYRFVVLEPLSDPDLPDLRVGPPDRRGMMPFLPDERVSVFNSTGRSLQLGIFQPTKRIRIAAQVEPGQSWSRDVEQLPSGEYYLVLKNRGWIVFTRAKLTERCVRFVVMMPDDIYRSIPVTSESNLSPAPRTNNRPLVPEAPQAIPPRATLPPIEAPLSGRNEIRVRNPNSYGVEVQIRTGIFAANFNVPSGGVASTYGPNGKYEIFFIHSDQPEALYQGDDFTLTNNGVEIQLVRRLDGNYNVRRVK